MKIENYLDEVKTLCESGAKAHPEEKQMVQAMYRAVECTIYASKIDNDNRLSTFIQLLMTGNKGKEYERLLFMPFIGSIIAADYYFSVQKNRKAVSFLNDALERLADYLEEVLPILIADTDEFIYEYRVLNLKDQNVRKENAVKNILILNGIVQKLDIDLSLSEILLNNAPISWHFKDMSFILLLALSGGTCFAFPLAECMAPWRKALADGIPVSLLDAFVPMDLPYLFLGLILIALGIFMVWWSGTSNYIQWISKWAYWRFCKGCYQYI